MEIPALQRLSVKQASVTVLVAFLIGTLLSLVQVGVDYASEDAAINREIEALLKVTHAPASRISYNIDNELAQEQVAGLLRSPAVIRAEIIDVDGVPLAQAERSRRESRYRPFSDYLFGETRTFETRLNVNHAPDEPLGVLRVVVDTYAFGSPFLDRALVTLINGFVRSLLLALVLLILFYAMLTKPLVGLIGALNKRNPEPLPCPPGHDRDEIGVLVRTLNEQMLSINREMAQRHLAENLLTRHLSELENVVSARTSELREANDQLSQSNHELERARQTAMQMAQARSAFLAHMSHEIRTPLNGLLGMLELALDGPLTTEQRQQLDIAHDSGKVLVELLNDVLDLSKFEAGQVELERIPMDIGALVEDTASLLSQNAAPGVELTCLVAPEVPALVLGDPTRVRQIISNLLSNALKFTRRGRVDLTVQHDGEQLHLQVKDTGIGIPAHVLPKLFQPFMQGSAGTTRLFGGTGLGLALARTLCEAMHGRMEVTSEEGSGSTFSVTLPLSVHAQEQPLPPMNGCICVATANTSGLRELLDQCLPGWGLHIVDPQTVEPGSPPDAVVTDRIDELDLLRERYPRSPMLLVAAYGGFLSSDRSEALQPIEQVARPVPRLTLYLALRRLLNGLDVAVPSSVHAVREGVATGRILLVEDNAVNQMVARAMLTRMGFEVCLAGNGAEALEQMQDNDIDLILMDCNMPVMDGYEATRRIREEPLWRDLPIVALTANALADERERCRMAGMNDYLAKPFSREELRAVLDSWLPLPEHALN